MYKTKGSQNITYLDVYVSYWSNYKYKWKEDKHIYNLNTFSVFLSDLNGSSSSSPWL